MRKLVLSALILASAFQTALGAVEGQWTYIVENDGATITASTATGAVTFPSELGGYAVKKVGNSWPPIFGFPNTSVTSVVIPDSVTSIGNYAFYSCANLTSVTIGNSVISIGDFAFGNCTSLTSVTIPSSVTEISSDAFGNCVLLSSVSFLGATPPSVGTNAFNGVAAEAIGYYPAGAEEWSGFTINGLTLTPTGLSGGEGGGLSGGEGGGLSGEVGGGLSGEVGGVLPTDPGGELSTVPAPVLSGLPATMVYQQKVVLAGAVSALQKITSTTTAIPDYNGAAIRQTMTIAGLTAGTNYQLNLGINVSELGAGCLGDLKIYLQHTLVSEGVTMVDQTRTILDRVGVTAEDTTGSLATGLNVIMSDSGAANIQSSDTPAHSATPLTGTWQPASLSGGTSFGLSTMGTKSDGSFDWNGDWALVVADLANGGTMQLDSWSMQFSDLSASGTSVETAGLEYEVVAPTSGPARASISGNELEALSGAGTFRVRARYRAVDGVSLASDWTTKTISLEKKAQSFEFNPPSTVSLSVGSINPMDYTGSEPNLTPLFTIQSANARLENGRIVFLSAGEVVVEGFCNGDSNYLDSTRISKTIQVQATPINPFLGLNKLYTQNSTNGPTVGVIQGTNTYTYEGIQYAEASALAGIASVKVESPTNINFASLERTNEIAPGVIGYSSYSNPASFTSYSEATNAVPAGDYTFRGMNASNEVVTNAVVNWSNNTNDYPVQAPQIGGTWVAQSLRLAEPANPNTISWAAWTNTPVEGSTNSIRVEVTGSMLSFSSPVTVSFATNLPADSTNLAIRAGVFPANQVFSAKVAFVTMTGGAARSTETQFRMITGPKNPPANPVLPGALSGNINVAPSTDVVGTLEAFSDSDGDQGTFSLPYLTWPYRNDNNLFVLDGRTIKLAAGNFDYTRQSFYSILVRATDSDGLYSETTYTVSVQGEQTITFNDLAPKTFGDAPFDLTATAPGGQVTYTSSNPGVATIEGSAVTIKGAGFADITASQAGGGAYLAAETVVKRLTINKAVLTITELAPTDSKTYGEEDYILSVTKGASTSALTFASSEPGVATIDPNGLVSIKGAGTTTLTVNQAADDNYNAATQVSQTLTVNQATSTISVTGVTRFTYDSNPQGPDTSTTTGSTGAVTYEYAGTSGTTYGPNPTKPTVVGNYTVTAAVANDANYGGATSEPTAFEIGVKTLTIMADDKSRGFGAENPALTGSVVSGAVDGESFEVTASTTATATSAPGSYSIVPDVTGTTLSNYSVSKTNGTLTVSNTPFAGEDALTAAPAPSTSTKYSFAQLLLNDSTFSGTLSITGVAAISGETQGTVSTKGSWVVYVPKADAPAGTTDSFDYTLSNGTSTTTGRVTISLVSPDMTISVELASAPTAANDYKATFLVMPGLVFEAYGSNSLGDTYQKIGTTWTSASNGRLEVTDNAAAVATSRFYKLKWLPGGAVSPIGGAE